MRRTAARTKPAIAPAETGKREAILAAALRLFAERGFHGTAVPLVAEEAGVGAGTVYRYFESKEALVNALYREWKQRLGQTLLEGLPLDAPARAKFQEMWRRLALFAKRHPTALAFLELHHHQPYLDGESRAMDELILQPVRDFVVRAQAERTLKPFPADLLIAIVFGAFAGVIKGAQSHKVELTQALWDQAESCLWEAVRA
jgi:AcrR family transcriptional regulator